MTVYTVVAPTPIAFSGLGPTGASVFDVEAPDPIQFEGLPAVGIEPAIVTTTPDAVRARVLDDTGAFVRHLPNAQGLRWLDEFNTAGSGSIDTLRYEVDGSVTTLGGNLAPNPSGEHDNSGWSPPLALTADYAPGASPPAPTALHAQIVTGFARDFNCDPINVGPAVKTVRVTWWGYVTGAGDDLTLSFYRSNSDFSASELIGSPTVIVPADGWVAVTQDFNTSSTYPYVVVGGHLNATASDADAWVTALSVQVVTTTAQTTTLGDIDTGSQIMISVGSIDVFRMVLDAEPGYRIDPDTGNRVEARAGAGAMGVLNSGMCWPEYGWRPEGTDERSFDYGSNPAIGGWLVGSEWKTPVGKPVRKSWRWTYRKRHLPKAWPDKHAEWLWWRNPDSTNVVDETCYFRSSFTLNATRRIKIWVCGDDTLELQVDGEVRATAGPGGWKKAMVVTLNLSAGTHYVAAKVQNTSGSSGNANRSGFLCSIARLNGDGDVVEWVRRTTPATWTVRRQRTAPPGWFAAQILRQLVAEQKARGCAGHAPVTYGFTTAVDSAGRAWSGRQEMSIPVGTAALDYIQQLVEAGIDVAMTPALKLNAWHSRGADRSGRVRLDQNDGHALDESGSQPPAIRNTVYARAKTGWVGRTNSTSVAAVGARETMANLGGSRSAAQTGNILTNMLPDLSDPPQTIEVKVSGAAGKWQPYRDFNVGDWVGYRPAGATTWGKYRVMSIAGEVTEAGYPDWTIQLYEG